MGFAIGDQVEWTSQAGGYTKTKQGTVLAVVPKDADPQEVLATIGMRLTDFRTKSWGSALGSRPQESYLITIPSASGHGMPMIFWPLSKNLKKAKPTVPAASVAQ